MADDLATGFDGIPLGAPFVLEPKEAIEAGAGEDRGGEERPLAMEEDRPPFSDGFPGTAPSGGHGDRNSYTIDRQFSCAEVPFESREIRHGEVILSLFSQL